MENEENTENREMLQANSARIPQEEKKTEIMTFVESLFLCQGKKISNGIAIEMDEGSNLVVSFFEKEKLVEVYIDKVIMGEFVPYDGQGYKYKFIQHYRKGIRNGLTKAELLVENTCISNDDTIKLIRAYNK